MRDFSALHPELQEKATLLKAKCASQGIHILFSECVRTKAEQDALYAQGRTKPGSIVTNAKGSTYSSQHQWGIAVDFYLDMDIDGDGSKSDDAFNNNTKMFNKVGKIATEMGLGWGGNWTSIVDMPHLYLADWGSTASQLKNTYGTPEAFMNTWKANGNEAKEEINIKNEYERTEFIMDVQAATGSKVDGKAGSETIGNTITVSRAENQNHPVVTALERRLKALGYYTGAIEADQGKTPCFGKGMEEAVKKYQKEVLGHKNPDGEITAGKSTWKSLLGIGVEEYSLVDFITDVQEATGSKPDGVAGDKTIVNTITVSRTENKNHKVVTALERRLKQLGFYKGEIEADLGKTPTFGKGLEKAVNDYQDKVLGYNKLDGEVTAKGKMWKSLLGML